MRAGLPTGALFDKAASVAEMGQAPPLVPGVPARRQGGDDSHEPAAAGHRLARRLLRLPHVLPRPGRMADRTGERADLVYSPLDGRQGYPEDVDVCLSKARSPTRTDLEKIRRVRARTRILVSFGDCAVTANVPAMRNPIGLAMPLFSAHTWRTPTRTPRSRTGRSRGLLPTASMPVHDVVAVDVFLPAARRRPTGSTPRPGRPARRPAAGPVAPGLVRPVGVGYDPAISSSTR